MKSRRAKLAAVATVLLAAFFLLGAGVRIRTQTGWRLESTSWPTVPLAQGDVTLHLRLVDTRNQQRLTYAWSFKSPPPGAPTPAAAVDCGEFKRILIWNRDFGLVYYGARFRRQIPLGESASGATGVYQYDYKWTTKEPKLAPTSSTETSHTYDPEPTTSSTSGRRPGD